MTDHAYRYQPLRTLGTVTLILLILQVVAEVVVALAGLAGAFIDPAFYDDSVEISGPGLALALLILLGTVAFFPLLIATIVTFLMWFYRAAANLRAFGAEGLRTSPGWAVGWWFIPFANLFKPYQAAHEVYLKSAEFSRTGNAASVTPLGWWWGAWIVSNLLAQASLRMSIRGGPDVIYAAFWLDFIGATLSIVAAALLIQIIRRVTAWQAETASLAAEGTDLPDMSVTEQPEPWSSLQ